MFSIEKEKPQVFIIDLFINCDLRTAGRTDNLADTLDYAEVYAEVGRIVQEKSFNLLEALAQAIADRILGFEMVKKVKVIVKKPNPPIEGVFDFFAAEIERE